MLLLVIEMIVIFGILYSIPIDIKGMYFLSLAIWNKIKLSTLLTAYADNLYKYDYFELFKGIILSLDFSLAIISLLIWTLIKEHKLLNLISLLLIVSIPIETVIFVVKNWGFLSFTEEEVEFKALITLMDSLNFKLFIFISIEFLFSFLLLFTSMSINNKIAFTLFVKFLFSCTVDLFDLLKYVLFAWSDIDSQFEKIVLFLNRENRFPYKKWK